ARVDFGASRRSHPVATIAVSLNRRCQGVWLTMNDVYAGVSTSDDSFVHRHIGPSDAEIQRMLAALGLSSLDQLIDQTVPRGIRVEKPLQLDPPRSEFEALAELRGYANQNRVLRSMIGMGYHDTITPPVIKRAIFENPGWYTQYTPYQAEI